MSKEQISAFADGELAETHIDLALAALRQPEAQQTWDLYHQIGDTLRSEEMAFSLSEHFAAKMAARLAAEPLILAPQAAQGALEPAAALVNAAHANGASKHPVMPRQFMRRFGVPGVAVAAAVAAIVFVAVPQHPALTNPNGDNALATATTGGSGSTASVVNVATASGSLQRAGQISALSQQGERDANIDEYLVAHQRFSPAMYSSAQYARSAGFTINSDK